MPAELQLTRQEVSNRRRSPWRRAVREKLEALGPHGKVLADGFLAHVSMEAEIEQAQDLLATLSLADRLAIWTILFPAMANEIELAWTHLDAVALARRQGGYFSSGDHFTWPVSTAEGIAWKFAWLRSLMICVTPLPELELATTLENSMQVCGGMGEEYTGDARTDSTGQSYCSNAPAFAAVAVLEQMAPGHGSLAELLERGLTGQIPNLYVGCAMTALLCSNRPDLWARVDHLMVEAGLEAGFRGILACYRRGSHWGAWRHFLETCVTHNLCHLQSISGELLRNFRMVLMIQGQSPEFRSFVACWQALSSDPVARATALTSRDPMTFLLGLWTTAHENAVVALDVIRQRQNLTAEQRLVAAHFLGLCGHESVNPIALEYVMDPDQTVAAAAAHRFNPGQTKECEIRQLFDRLLAFIKSDPVQTPGLVVPTFLPVIAPDPQAVLTTLVGLLRDGNTAEVEALIPKMTSATRTRIVYRIRDLVLAPIREPETLQTSEVVRKWLSCPESGEALIRRRMLLKLAADPSKDLSKMACDIIAGLILLPEEQILLLPLLRSASTVKRHAAMEILAKQPDALVTGLSLLKEKSSALRLGGLEVLRRLAATDEHGETIRNELLAMPFVPNNADEDRAFKLLEAQWTPPPQEAASPILEKPSIENAFGLVDPSKLPLPVSPQERNVLLHSPVTLAIVRHLQQWYLEHQDCFPDGTRSDEERSDGVKTLRSNIPTFWSWKSAEENLARFPLIRSLIDWWNSRPPKFRDSDGFERHRLWAFYIARSPELTRYPEVMQAIFGTDNWTGFPELSRVMDLFSWLRGLSPATEMPQEFLLDATETVFARCKKLQKPDTSPDWAAQITSQSKWPFLALDAILTAPPAKMNLELMTRLWQLSRGDQANRCCWGPTGDKVLKLHRLGIATEEETIWFYLGKRHSIAKVGSCYFSDFTGTALPSSHIPRSAESTEAREADYPENQPILNRMRERVFNLELGRGESVEDWTYAVAGMKYLPGAARLVQCLAALCGLPPERKGRSVDAFARTAVLTHLIRVCHPLPTDTPEAFRAQLAPHRIPRSRLFEIAILSPQWIDFIACATGVPGLRDAVEWWFAHLREPSWQWQANAKQLWEGSLDLRTPLTPQNLMDGEVDVAWFFRAYAAVGEEIWNELHASAKFATSGGGHARARLAADVLLGRTTVKELQERIETNANIDAVRTVGLPPLPDDEWERRGEVLRRYKILQAFRRIARKSKAQLRASQEAAFEAGLHNLARKAGCEDPIRFEWLMEAEAAADLTSGSLQTTIGETAVALVIQPDGTLDLAAKRAGEKLAKVPPAIKLNPCVKALLERQKELAAQAHRLRPALESLMVNGMAMPAAEWQMILRHPLAGPLLARLVLATDAGPLGYPDIATGRISGIAQNYISWPDDEPIHIAHPLDLLPASQWHAWQQDVFARGLVQPFKQLFRETYLATEAETISSSVSNRFDRQQIDTARAFGILSGRMWVYHPEHGLHRTFRADGVVAGLHFNESFHHPGEIPNATIAGVGFSDLPGKPIPLEQVSARVFSEVLRDVDLIVSIAHATGANPEAAVSTVAMRADLIRETCAVLGLGNVALHPSHAAITGTLGNYRVHLASGLVHRDTGPALPLSDVPEPERGRIFLPFADEDPLTASIITRVILFAGDAGIKDPVIARLLRS